MLSKALNFYEQNKDKYRFTNVHYSQLVEDPMNVLNRIYADRNETISPELERIFLEANQKNPKGKYGKHLYSMDDFGIDKAFIDQYTLDYQKFQKEII